MRFAESDGLRGRQFAVEFPVHTRRACAEAPPNSRSIDRTGKAMTFGA
jgi:hypothetical protein